MRASKANIQNTILEAIGKASKEAYEYCGVHIGKMPEYFLNVSIVTELTETHSNLGYRLEMPVKETLKMLGLESSQNPGALRANGHFDIAIISKKSKQLRHIIEVKRTLKAPQLLKEAIRLKALATENHLSKRLETGYIVAVRKLKESTRAQDAYTLIEKRIASLKKELGDSVNISGLMEVFTGAEFGLADNEQLLAMVLCLEKAD